MAKLAIHNIETNKYFIVIILSKYIYIYMEASKYLLSKVSNFNTLHKVIM